MKKQFTRREFLLLAGKGIGVAVVSSSLAGCFTDSDKDQELTPATFDQGVASGDPTTSAVILWTRVTPLEGYENLPVVVSFEVATDNNFSNIIRSGSTTVSPTTDYTVKIDAIDLAPNTTYFYRFITKNAVSTVGKTKTLADTGLTPVKLAVMSCANYTTGLFNAYGLASAEAQLDAVVHLGDYIYEYGVGGYAGENAEALGRVVEPSTEIITLSDYRTRHKQVKGDNQLQQLHANVAFITVWDDHEVTNDSYKTGAENHQEDEGLFADRKIAALQAYFEWMPIRPVIEGNNEVINRSFRFGDLVDLHMLDTRLIGRDKQLDYADYVNNTGSIDSERLQTDLASPNRTLLGEAQFNWLNAQITNATAKWQVLGQQVLMGKMLMPAAIATQQLSIAQYAELGALLILLKRFQAGDPSLSAEERAYLEANQTRLTPEIIALLQLPNIPYNLDAWDGYANEREKVFALSKQNNKNLVVLAGDTHNAWANQLTDVNNEQIGYEFATSSITSPGLESYLNMATEEIPATEAAIVDLIEGLTYMNASDRGFMVMTFTENEAIAEWRFIDSILTTNFNELKTRKHTMRINPTY